MCAGQMKPLFKAFKHSIYWAGNGFLHKGIWTYHNGKNIRLIPLNRFKSWGKENDEE